MPIKLENVGIAVRSLEATIAFFTDLGLTVLGRDTVSGEWTDTAVGLDGNHANIALLQTPDGNGRIELFEYIHPEAIETKPTLPNEIGTTDGTQGPARKQLASSPDRGPAMGKELPVPLGPAATPAPPTRQRTPCETARSRACAPDRKAPAPSPASSADW
ncbi:hypothetical protein [Pseudarthrobacter sp. NamE2]|uniref:hypothetical protein n=1 Tax=Pseudarthrobacter sp. NamE2 TaxID=2576838 RepID=UPI001F0CFF4E|nr:hypothetical protein [Pseudarthrobacter sp. NamE2]